MNEEKGAARRKMCNTSVSQFLLFYIVVSTLRRIIV